MNDHQTSSEIARIKNACRSRDGMKCVRCGKTNDQHLAEYGGQLQVHRTSPGSRYSEAPGVCETLCCSCHGKEPRRAPGEEDLAYRSDVLDVPRSFARRVRRLAAHHRVRPGDYLAALIGPVLDEDEK